MAKKVKKELSEEAKAKRKARKEELKNRPAGQRTNSKQMDVIEGDGYVIKNYGYPIKQGKRSIGVLITSVTLVDGKAVAESTTFVPGNLVIRSKKEHGTIVSQKHAKEEHDDEEPNNED